MKVQNRKPNGSTASACSIRRSSTLGDPWSFSPSPRLSRCEFDPTESTGSTSDRTQYACHHDGPGSLDQPCDGVGRRIHRRLGLASEPRMSEARNEGRRAMADEMLGNVQ